MEKNNRKLEIEIPDNTYAISLTIISMRNDHIGQFEMKTKLLDTDDINNLIKGVENNGNKNK